MLHDWDEPVVRQLLGKSFAALPPGGLVLVHDAYLNAAKNGPLHVAEYSVLLMHSSEGRCYSVAEMESYLIDAGFRDVALRRGCRRSRNRDGSKGLGGPGIAVLTDALATELLEALDRNQLIETISGRHPEFNGAAAYHVSAEILRRRRARGDTPVGRKIGFTNRLIWDEYGVSSPMWGHVYDSTVTRLDQPAARLPIGHLSQPRIEPEIVLHFAQPPGAATNEIELLATIDWIAHGFEIVQTHFLDWKFTLADTIADFGLHGALVVGPPRPGRGIGRSRPSPASLYDCPREERCGAGDRSRCERARQSAHGRPASGARVERSAVLRTRFDAGEIVTTGTLTPALPIHAGETWTTSLSGIDLPGLTLRFD